MTQNSKSLIEEAREAVDAGFVLAGLLQAGVAFEQAVVAKAKRHGLKYGFKPTVSKMIKRLETVMPKKEVKQLFAVWEIRNQLSHLTVERITYFRTHPELLDRFEYGIQILETLQAKD